LTVSLKEYPMMPFRRTFPFFAFLFFLAVSASAQNIDWKRIQIDSVFRSEGVAVADINRDGRNDIIAGDVWYEAPPFYSKQWKRANRNLKEMFPNGNILIEMTTKKDWVMHAFRPVGKYIPQKGYSQSFVNATADINGDGWQDIIVIGFPGAPFSWYENPRGNFNTHWKKHLIWHSACNESPLFLDLTGDGKPELIMGSQPERQMGFLPLPNTQQAKRKWTFHAITTPGDPAKNGTFRYYHGLGVGDINRDGRKDILIPHGWWEGPSKISQEFWKFHPWTLSPDGKGNPLPSANIYAYDLDLDGDNDLMMSSAHSFGIWWFENIGGDDNPKFRFHEIDKSFSQTHALHLADINGDGTLDLITGKRYFAHQGRDPGGKQPVAMFWYEIQRKRNTPPRFIRHEIEAGRNTGIGTQFRVTDFDKDGLLDIVLSNKKGVNLLLQRRN